MKIHSHLIPLNEGHISHSSSSLSLRSTKKVLKWWYDDDKTRKKYFSMSNIGWNKSTFTTFSFVVKRKKSGRPWYWTLGIHLWWKKFGLFSISIWWKRSDVSCTVLLPRGFGSLSLWTYQRTNKSKRPQSVGPKRFFCPGCWAAAWTSTTSSSGPSYSRTSSSGTSSRSCTERDCLLPPTNGMNNSYSIT